MTLFKDIRENKIEWLVILAIAIVVGILFYALSPIAFWGILGFCSVFVGMLYAFEKWLP